MSLQDVLAAMNLMQADRVVDRYAIGGAVGATFYLEPVATLDVDIFIDFYPAEGQLIVSPQPVFEYLAEQGYPMEGEYIIIAGWPVQFLPPAGALLLEALNEAVEMDVAGTRARVLTAEHLAAIALQTGRAKDKARLLQFVEAQAIDAARFQAIIERHDLEAAWHSFQRRFLSDSP